MNKKVEIGVICALYNGEKFIIEQLESIYSQTLPPDKVLLADDGSTDHTYEIVYNWITSHKLEKSWILVRNEENYGHAKNFIEMLKKMNTEYVLFCDQDDIWLPDKIEVMTKQMEYNTCINVLCSKWYDFQNEKGTPKSENIVRGTSKCKRVCFSKYNFWPHETIGAAMIIRKKAYQAYTRYWNPNIEHDCFVWACSNLTNSSYYLDYITSLRRVHGNNASMQKSYDFSKRMIQIESRIQECDNLKNLLEDEGYKEANEQNKWLAHYRQSLLLRATLLKHFSIVKAFRIALRYRDCYLYFPQGLILDSLLSLKRCANVFIKK